ncbi:class I SAM-dependent methyltransferase [Leptospira ilyithenensis]|uniref:Class I SAM-dependent methyltransferase n=1 Tax=Leptospira ilyithenensis TaxID=2484901 RepID=A0A4R9LS13_9LEPT|nr:class I SAM-dependent methyltransferase [Leptospira ilyithenensis]TGN09676.1 class I SAM-dependent methyltransferase [Leptospira ilyithenensis]
MNFPNVKGIEGYSISIDKFIDATTKIEFSELHKDFLIFLTDQNASILDIGAGIGRDAFYLANIGHSVIAVEPLQEFIDVGKKLYPHQNIRWINDSLPNLESLNLHHGCFDFILASGIWHHLNDVEQLDSLIKIKNLLKPNGIFALSLRNGPPGLGTHVFPTNTTLTVIHAQKIGLKKIFLIENQPSLIKSKKDVFWSKLVLQN